MFSSFSIDVLFLVSLAIEPIARLLDKLVKVRGKINAAFKNRLMCIVAELYGVDKVVSA